MASDEAMQAGLSFAGLLTARDTGTASNSSDS
jgi:hypothetical protein